MPLFFRIPFIPRAKWVDLAEWMARGGPDPSGDPLELTEERIHNWALVLQARRVPYKIRMVGGVERILAPPGFAERAAREVASFEAENPEEGDHGEPPAFEPRAHWPEVWLPLGLLAVFHLLTKTPLPRLGMYPAYWLRHGEADAELILDGSWWRAVTALTLHGDAAHLASNVAVGGVLAWLVLRETGAGLGWACIMASGAAGNLLTAWIMGGGHHSIGFSTAVFGAAGVLAGLGALRPVRSRPLKFAPLAAGLGLVAMLGSGGENTDLTAHLFGFLTGLPLGGLCAWLAATGRLPVRGLNLGLAVAAWMLPVAGWLLSGYP